MTLLVSSLSFDDVLGQTYAIYIIAIAGAESAIGLEDEENFLQWFVGFSDAESTFIINPSMKKDKVTISSFSFMFKIALHQDDSGVLRYISKLVNNKAHLTVEGIKEIVNIKASMNLGLSDMLISEFAGYIPVERPVINYDNVILNPY
ncbi:LAGLIDADG endonuclease [Pyrenophora seminiperda CCB06]|uniref:LAGLIDADG endonuclease (Mitochondrion) n=1 Tax=Pyrenophora seminiperda CCB06 TaxID=1302712 RepID=A0A3M7M581_9PLEO|nr:LAGLIDADG endonuclease [Pyrenophora seminiperda CCB06]